MRGQEKLYRIRPADVAGAGQLTNQLWPVVFDASRPAGIAILLAMSAGR
jgi:hypothetical protein